MQQRNFVLFMVLSFLILVGWVWMQNKLWPPPKRNQQVDKVAEKIAWPKFGPAGSVSVIAKRSLPLGNLLDGLTLVQDLRFPEEPRPYARWSDLTEEERNAVLTFLPSPMPTTLGLVAQWFPRGQQKAPEPAPEKIAFGGPDFNIQGVFTTRGAGVENLTLNQFQAANWLGEPTPDKLELIGDDPEVASFLMYHYPATVKKGKWDNPVLSLGEQIWKLESNKVLGDGTQEVRFSTTVPEEAYKNIRIFKTFRLAPHDYHLTLLIEIKDERKGTDGDTKPIPFRYQLAGAHGLPIEGVWYTSTYRDAVIGMVDAHGNLWRTKEASMHISVKEGGELVDTQHVDSLQYAGAMTQYFGSIIAVDDEQPAAAAGGVDGKSILRSARPTLVTVETKGILKDFDNKFLYIADPTGLERAYVLLPRVKEQMATLKLAKNSKVVVSSYDLAGNRRVATWIRPGQSPRSYFDDVSVGVNSEEIKLKPGQKVAHQFLLYHGPVKVRLLSEYGGAKAVDQGLVDRYADRLHLRTLTDYPSAGPFGSFSQKIHFTDLLIFVTNVMHSLLYYLHVLVGSYGLTIILLTVIVRGLMFPISKKQAYFSVKMAEIGPELKKLKEKYPNDRKAQTEAQMELYRKHNVSPLGSCLPVLLQMPIFLGLYYALQESIHFRLAGFLWIKNLAAPDMLLWWTEKIPYLSTPDNLGGLFYLGPFLNILPIIAVALMIVQQKMMTPPAMDEQQEMQQKMMKYMMVFFGILFYKFASGLCLYYIASTLWGVAERRLLPRRQPALAAAGAAPMPTKPGSAPPKGKGPKGRLQNKKAPKPNGKVQQLKDLWAEVLKQAKKK